MATGGEMWYELLAAHNSGTYNNQYMVSCGAARTTRTLKRCALQVVNYNLFEPTKALQPNTLWVLEQIPGLVVGTDVTRDLELGYFASYNIPCVPRFCLCSACTLMRVRPQVLRDHLEAVWLYVGGAPSPLSPL